MLLFPNAKINIGLYITEKRSDGFHNLESLFYPVGFSDILEIVISDEQQEYNFCQSGIKLGIPKEDNLCVRALNLLSNDYDFPGIDIHLHKIIPTGSGLGGGSSDSVFVLKALNELLSLGISKKMLFEYAARLGSDCPFFINNQPTIVRGRGDILETTDFTLSGYYIILIVPDISINTAHAFSLIKPHVPDVSIEEIVKEPVENWKALLINDFETEVFKAFPQIRAIKEELYNMGAVYVSMSGSGSAVYGVFNKRIDPGKKFGKNLVYTQDL